MVSEELVQRILTLPVFAVAGASRDRRKFGYKVFWTLANAGLETYPVNPNADAIEGQACYPTVAELPRPAHCMITVTQPEVTEKLMHEAAEAGIHYVWMQPGSESKEALLIAEARGLEVVHGGPCIMVELRRRGEQTSRG